MEPKYYDGYKDAVAYAQIAPIDGLLNNLFMMQGAGNVPNWNDIDAVRTEVLRQLEIEWRMPADTAETFPEETEGYTVQIGF